MDQQMEENIHENNGTFLKIYIIKLIVCKSDPAELPKSWFLVNNISEKFAKLSAWFGAFFSILNDLNGLEGCRGHQPGKNERQFGCEGHHGCEKVSKGHRWCQTFETNFDKEQGLTQFLNC